MKTLISVILSIVGVLAFTFIELAAFLRGGPIYKLFHQLNDQNINPSLELTGAILLTLLAIAIGGAFIGTAYVLFPKSADQKTSGS